MKLTKVKSVRMFWILLLIYLLLMISDFVLTYIGTPDLALEANPLVSELGLNWGALFVSNFIYLLVYIISVYYSFVKYESPDIQCENFKEYCSMLWHNKPNQFLFKLPKNQEALFACIGYAYGISFIIMRLLTVSEWILYLSGNAFYKQLSENVELQGILSRLDTFLLIILFIIFISHWCHKEYKTNFISYRKG